MLVDFSRCGGADADIITFNLDNSKQGEIVFVPCCGSGAHFLVAKNLSRDYLGVELNEGFYSIATNRIMKG